jgi:hypothetical protein
MNTKHNNICNTTRFSFSFYVFKVQNNNCGSGFNSTKKGGKEKERDK